MTAAARILVADDDAEHGQRTAKLLRRAGHAVVVAHSLHDALTAARRDQLDLVVTEAVFGDGDAFSSVPALTCDGRARLIFLSRANRLPDRLAGFGAGADDYVGKGCVQSELLARVDVALRRVAPSADAATCRVADLEIDTSEGRARRNGTPIALTPLEFRLLTTLAHNAGITLSKTQLLREVWGYDRYSGNVVERHISRVRHKLELNGPRLIHTVHGFGYVLHA